MNKSWYISIFPKIGINEPLMQDIKTNLNDFGIEAEIFTIQNYMIHGALNEEQVAEICRNLLIDHVSHQYLINENNFTFPNWKQAYTITIRYKQGVMDATGLSVKQMIQSIGLKVYEVKSGTSILLKTDIEKDKLANAIKNFLVNDLIEDFSITEEKPKKTHTTLIPLSDIDSDALMQLSKDHMLSLNVEEMKKIQHHYQKIGREPYDVELETIAQTWSEHCIHKTFSGTILYQGKEIQSLLKSFIMKATEEIEADWCISVFTDNAGIIKFDDRYGLAVKVETHNHPTALDPYGGAGTGSGGVFRDVMGVGAKPILSTDNLFFGSLDISLDKLPRGVMHPKRLLKGSVSGIRDYGNKMGIPTANGSIGFHKDYLGNPLVYAGCVGILPLKKYVRNHQTGDLVVLVGGKTGRDGIHGVTFASETLTYESEVIASSAVQIGNPLEQKRVLDALLKARDHEAEPLYSAITDCGGGGLSSAIGEMGKDLGVEVNLEKVPLKYDGLLPWEIWISESQERMLLAVPPKNIEKMKEIFDLDNSDLSVIGQFTDSKTLVLTYHDEIVCNLSMEFLHKGIPKVHRNATEYPCIEKTINLEDIESYNKDLRLILAHPMVASKAWIIRQYDHEVQANTITKPLQGEMFDAHGDSCVIKPLTDSWQGFVTSNGFNPSYSRNPRKMALSSIDEAIRNNICSGGRRFAILDNFSWGNPEDGKNLGALVEACQACYEAAIAFKTPFISGKDSLYNDFKSDDGEIITIPHTLLITSVGIVPDIRKSITTDFKSEKSYIYLVGETYQELGGSVFYDIRNIQDGEIPDVDLAKAKLIFDKMIQAIDQDLILSCHDCSDGGLAVTIAEMCFGGNLGVTIDLNKIKTSLDKDYKILFSESNSRFVVEVKDCKAFETWMDGVPIHNIGKITGDKIIINGLMNKNIINERISDLKEIWKKTFDW